MSSSSSGFANPPVPECSCDCCDCYEGAGGQSPKEANVDPHHGTTTQGMNSLNATQSGRGGYNMDLGNELQYSNLGNGAHDDRFGLNWSNHNLPFLAFDGSNVLFQGGSTENILFKAVGSGFQAPYFVRDVLEFDPGTSRYILTSPDGEKKFFETGTGLLVERQDAFGNSVTYNYTTGELDSIVVGSGATAVSYHYTWNVDGQLDNVILRVGTPSSSASDVRQTVYTYTVNGELEQITLNQKISSSWVAIENVYYRYISGSPGLIKFVVGKAAYEQMNRQNGAWPQSASDGVVEDYADYQYTYDGNNRVASVKTHGGTYTYTFSYGASAFSGTTPDIWMSKTAVTHPDSSVHTYYYNRDGSLLLKKVASGSDVWYPICQRFDDNARIVLSVTSSGVNTVNEGASDLFTLKSTTGINTIFEYDSVGNLLRISLRHGADASQPTITQRESEYDSHYVGGIAIWYRVSDTVYREASDTAATEPVTTYYAYEWHQVSSVDTSQISKKTTTLPAVVMAENGDGLTGTLVEEYDTNGFLTKRVDAIGTATTFTYFEHTGALASKVEDSGMGKMNLTTDYLADPLGRQTQKLGPVHTISLNGIATAIRQAKWRQYIDVDDEVRTIRGFYETATANSVTVNPVIINREDAVDPEVTGGRMNEQIAVVYSGLGVPSSSTIFTQSDYVRWSMRKFSKGGELTNARVYHFIPSSGTGSNGTNYGQLTYEYDLEGRRYQITSQEGTIRRTLFNVMSWPVEVKLGTSSLNFVTVALMEYDGGSALGDGVLTEMTQRVDSSSGNDRVTSYDYDWRNRRVQVSSDDGARTIVATRTYDNRNNIVRADEYITSVSAANLLNRGESGFDARNRLFRKKRYGVEVGTGTVKNPLTSETYFDQNNRVIRQTPAGKVGFTVTEYDAIGRATKSYKAFGPGPAISAPWSPADISASTVLTQFEWAYDDASNAISTVIRVRFDNATGTGALVSPSTQPKARISYRATYPDGVGRFQATADYGTNAASSWTRSATVPMRTEDKPLSGNGPDTNKTVEFEYNLENSLKTLNALNPTTGDQVTEWVYGVTIAQGSTLESNSLVFQKIFPDSTGGSDLTTYNYNRLGQVTTFTDQAGTVHDYTYDKFGRLTEDEATGSPPVDMTVKTIARSYDDRGLLEKVTSLDASPVVLSEVQFAYNEYSQVIKDYQEHSGAVNTSTTLYVGYNYADGSDNTIRLTSIVYPDGTVIDREYSDSASDSLSRPKGLSESSVLQCSYRYLGLRTVIGVKYDAANDVELTYENGGTGDAGDQYTGLDRFGRLVETIWQNSGGTKVHSLYGRNNFNGVVWRRDEQAHDATIDTEDNFYTYDGLYQVVDRQRGDLVGTSPNYTGITNLQQQEQWTYDETGNWIGYSDSGTSGSQARTNNEVNEVTALTSSSGIPTISYDPAGNMTSVPLSPSLSSSVGAAAWDAWNRLVSVSSTSPTTFSSSYTYDGLGRRLNKTVTSPSDSRDYYYDAQWRPLEERGGGVATIDRQYLWGARDRWDLVRRKRSVSSSLNEVFFCLRDYLDPVAVIDANASGVVVERYSYDAFGAPRVMDNGFSPQSPATFEWTFLFHGEFKDSDSEFYNYGYRYYSAGLGSWLSRDPMGYADSVNLYQALNNQPQTWLDNLGLELTIGGFGTFGDTDYVSLFPEDRAKDDAKFREIIAAALKKLCSLVEVNADGVVTMEREFKVSDAPDSEKAACCCLYAIIQSDFQNKIVATNRRNTVSETTPEDIEKGTTDVTDPNNAKAGEGSAATIIISNTTGMAETAANGDGYVEPPLEIELGHELCGHALPMNMGVQLRVKGPPNQASHTAQEGYANQIESLIRQQRGFQQKPTGTNDVIPSQRQFVK